MFPGKQEHAMKPKKQTYTPRQGGSKTLEPKAPTPKAKEKVKDHAKTD